MTQSKVWRRVLGIEASARTVTRMARHLGLPDREPEISTVGHTEVGSGLYAYAQLNDDRPWLVLADRGGYALFDDDADAAREMVGKIGDLIAMAEMAATYDAPPDGPAT